VQPKTATTGMHVWQSCASRKQSVLSRVAPLSSAGKDRSACCCIILLRSMLHTRCRVCQCVVGVSVYRVKPSAAMSAAVRQGATSACMQCCVLFSAGLPPRSNAVSCVQQACMHGCCVPAARVTSRQFSQVVCHEHVREVPCVLPRNASKGMDIWPAWSGQCMSSADLGCSSLRQLRQPVTVHTRSK
jgi:hypothetical protein